MLHLPALLARARALLAPLDERGQATAEYALVLLGVAALALLVLAWASTPTEQEGYDGREQEAQWQPQDRRGPVPP